MSRDNLAESKLEKNESLILSSSSINNSDYKNFSKIAVRSIQSIDAKDNILLKNPWKNMKRKFPFNYFLMSKFES